MPPSEQPPGGLLNFRRSLPGLSRSDTLSRLTPDGRRDLKALNFSRIIDLRSRTERAADPPPYLGHAAYLNLPLLPWRHRAFNEASAAARSNADHMTAMLDHAPNQIVTVLGAILDALPGPVLIRIPFVSLTDRNTTDLSAPRPEPVFLLLCCAALRVASARIERALQTIQSESVSFTARRARTAPA